MMVVVGRLLLFGDGRYQLRFDGICNGSCLALQRSRQLHQRGGRLRHVCGDGLSRLHRSEMGHDDLRVSLRLRGSHGQDPKVSKENCEIEIEKLINEITKTNQFFVLEKQRPVLKKIDFIIKWENYSKQNYPLQRRLKNLNKIVSFPKDFGDRRLHLLLLLRQDHQGLVVRHSRIGRGQRGSCLHPNLQRSLKGCLPLDLHPVRRFWFLD